MTGPDKPIPTQTPKHEIDDSFFAGCDGWQIRRGMAVAELQQCFGGEETLRPQQRQALAKREQAQVKILSALSALPIRGHRPFPCLQQKIQIVE